MPLDTSRIQALLFDFDGTICDTDQHLVEKIAHMLQRLPFLLRGRSPMEAARRFVMASETPVNRAYRFLDVTGVDKHAAHVSRMLKPAGGAIGKVLRLARKEREQFAPEPIEAGVDEALGALHDRYPMALISTSARPRVEAFLAHYGFAKYFDIVVTAQTTTYMKPHPQPLFYAAEHLGVPPEQCVMIGDTTVDMEAGTNAGAQRLGVLCGFGEEPELRRAGADHIVTTTSEVTRLLLT